MYAQKKDTQQVKSSQTKAMARARSRSRSRSLRSLWRSSHPGPFGMDQRGVNRRRAVPKTEGGPREGVPQGCPGAFLLPPSNSLGQGALETFGRPRDLTTFHHTLQIPRGVSNVAPTDETEGPGTRLRTGWSMGRNLILSPPPFRYRN